MRRAEGSMSEEEEALGVSGPAGVVGICKGLIINGWLWAPDSAVANLIDMH